MDLFAVSALVSSDNSGMVSHIAGYEIALNEDEAKETAKGKLEMMFSKEKNEGRSYTVETTATLIPSFLVAKKVIEGDRTEVAYYALETVKES